MAGSVNSGAGWPYLTVVIGQSLTRITAAAATGTHHQQRAAFSDEQGDVALIDSRQTSPELEQSWGRSTNRRLASRLPLVWHDPWKVSATNEYPQEACTMRIVTLLVVAVVSLVPSLGRADDSLARFKGGIGADGVSGAPGTGPTAAVVTRNIVRGVQPPEIGRAHV